MTDEIRELLDKSKQSFGAGKILYKQRYYDFSAGRLYYAMFYVVEALLLKEGMSFSKHSAVISAFAQHYIKKGIFPKEFHKLLLEAYHLRQIGDYGRLNSLNKEEIKEFIKTSENFISAIELYITQL